MRTAILIPCYNEAVTIEKVVKDFKKAMPNADIYVYDNNSFDGTDKIAEKAGAIVRYEYKQGKGNVVRAMFRDIDADCYIMVDGDDTYPVEAAPKIEDLILNRRVDMVVGDRLSSTYFEENKRPFHNIGNKLVRKCINIFFHNDLNDIMTGMRGFSYDFVKSFPILSKEFEIETEMSIFAMINNFSVTEIPIEYKDRIEGSESKLDTYSDGYKVIKMIFALVRDKRPLFYFTTVTILLLLIASIYFFPILLRFWETGFVNKIPTLVMIGTVLIIAALTFLTGVILHVLKKQHAQNLEHHMTMMRNIRKRNRK